MAKSSGKRFYFEDPEDVLRRFGYQIGRYIDERVDEADSKDYMGNVIRFDCKDVLDQGILAKETSSQNIGKVLSVIGYEVESFKGDGKYRVPIKDAEDLATELKSVDHLPTYQREIAMIERILSSSSEEFEKVDDIQSELEKELEEFDEEYAENFSRYSLQNRLNRTDKVQRKEGIWRYE